MSRTPRPWVGMSYAHVAMPFPHFDDEIRRRLTATLADDGWEAVPDDETHAEELDIPVLNFRWRHASGGVVTAVVLGWYPLVLTFGLDDGPRKRGGRNWKVNGRNRRAVQRLEQTATDLGGYRVSDAELERVVQACADRWRSALEARREVEEQRRWLEGRQCQHCGTWSAYGVLHCGGCSRRFAPADDADREERGRKAAEAIESAERRLESLGRGEGLFQNWPVPHVTQEAS